MKNILMIIACSLMVFGLSSGTPAIQAEEGDVLIGTYLNDEKDAKVRIFKARNGKYAGKVDWMKEPNLPNGKPKLDTNNPNKEKQSRTRLGLVIMKNFAYNAKEKKWSGGTIYDPKNGKTYDGYMTLDKDKKTLYLRGYVMGMTWLGRTAEWEKVK